jgi:hypothetical protein
MLFDDNSNGVRLHGSPEFFQTLHVAGGHIETLQHVAGHAIGVLKTLIGDFVREVLRHGIVEVVEVAALVLIVCGVVPDVGDAFAHLLGNHLAIGEVREDV